MTLTQGKAEAGFSLVEVLVALAVIAGMTGLLFDTIAANARFAAELRTRREATLVARSLLEQATVAVGQDALPTRGRIDGFAWRLTRRAGTSGARDTDIPLEEVRIDVSDARTGNLITTVRTLRLAR